MTLTSGEPAARPGRGVAQGLVPGRLGPRGGYLGPPHSWLREGLTYAMVHKVRENDRVVAVERWLILGTEGRLEAATVSRTVGTSLVESQHGTAARTRGSRGRSIDSARISLSTRR